MIPRLSGRAWHRRAASEPLPSTTPSPIPDRREAERIIRRFFSLIERFQLVDEHHAPEIKASLKAASFTTTSLPKARLHRKTGQGLETGAADAPKSDARKGAGKDRP